jgi:hypothetical protein
VTARGRSGVSPETVPRWPKAPFEEMVQTDTNFGCGTNKGLVPTSKLNAGKASAKREGIQQAEGSGRFLPARIS